MGGYDDEECNLETCFSCDFKTEIFFKLKGICPGKLYLSLGQPWPLSL